MGRVNLVKRIFFFLSLCLYLAIKTTPQKSCHCYLYLIKSAVSKLDQLSRVHVYVPLRILNFTFTMLYHRQATD